MADFSNLKALDVNDQTLAEYRWDLIPGRPSLWLAPATDANKAFQAERLRIVFDESAMGSTVDSPETRAAQYERDRELDRKLIAKTCAKRWGTAPVDVNGDAPEFSEANCYAFFKALPDYLFDPLRGWATNIYNFTPKAKTVTTDSADEVGNG